MAKIKNMGSATARFKEGLIISGSAHQPDGSDSSYSLINSGSLYSEGNLTINPPNDGDEASIQLKEAGSDRAKIGINDSNNLVIQQQFTNKHIVFKINDQGTTKEGLRIDGAVPEVVVNEGSDSLVDFRVESNNSTHMLFVDGSTDRVGVGTSNPTSPLHVQGNLDGTFVATIDNDENTNGHVLKLLTDGNGSGSRLLEMEDGDGDTIFRARADGRFGFGPDGVSSMGAGTFVVGIDNSSHTADIAISQRLQHLGDSNTYLDFPANDSIVLASGGNDAISIDDGGYVKLNQGIKYAKGVLVSASSSPAEVGGWIKFATLDVPGTSNLDTAASSFLITLAGMESSNNRRLDGIFLVHAKFTVNTGGSADGAGNYYENEGTWVICEPLNFDWPNSAGTDDFDPTTDLLLITTNDDSTPVVDLYIRAASKNKHCFVTHLGGTGQTGTFDTDAGWTINTGQSWVTSEPAAPAGSAKVVGDYASKIFSNLNVEKALYNKGAIFNNVKVISSFPYTVADDDYIIIVEGSGSRTINLPAKANQLGRTLIIKDGVGNASNNNITLDPDGNENINGASTKVMQSDRKSVTIVCSTDQWQIISEFTSG